MSPRRLSDDEHALWRGVTRSIAPLRKRAAPKSSAAPKSERDEPAKAQPAAKSRAKAAPQPAPRPAPVFVPPQPKPELAPLGRRARKQIARGSRSIDARLDLHGMTQDEAHRALLGFLRSTQGKGGKLALVITGKGSGEAFGGRGVLKRMVPLWLGQPEFREFIAGIEPASIRHGGEGALYVSLRRSR